MNTKQLIVIIGSTSLWPFLVQIPFFYYCTIYNAFNNICVIAAVDNVVSRWDSLSILKSGTSYLKLEIKQFYMATQKLLGYNSPCSRNTKLPKEEHN